MRERYKKIFETNPALLQEMLELRKAGWSYNALGRKYGCDHTSIMYQCRKARLALQKTEKFKHCFDCGKIIVPRAWRCIQCAAKARAGMSRKEWTSPILFIAQQREYADGKIEKINPSHNYKYYLQKELEKNKFNKLLKIKANVSNYA